MECFLRCTVVTLTYTVGRVVPSGHKSTRMTGVPQLRPETNGRTCFYIYTVESNHRACKKVIRVLFARSMLSPLWLLRRGATFSGGGDTR